MRARFREWLGQYSKIINHYQKRACVIVFESGWVMVLENNQTLSKTSMRARFREWSGGGTRK
jgi:hypothetical protein